MSVIRIYFLDFRELGADRGGAVMPGQIVRGPQTELDKIFGKNKSRQGTATDLMREERITFLVHGFNVNREYGRISLSRFAKALPTTHNQAIVVVLWPGDSSRLLLRHACYIWRTHDANACAHEFERFCHLRIRASTTLSFVSHSLGGRVVMETVKRLGRFYPIDQVCLMAAALDSDCLADADQYRAATSTTQRVGVLASKSDGVLGWAYGPGQHPIRTALAPSTVFMASKALGYRGPTEASQALFWTQKIPQNVTHEQISRQNKVGHGDYLPSGDPQDIKKKPTVKERAAASYADDVLRGAVPTYP